MRTETNEALDFDTFDMSVFLWIEQLRDLCMSSDDPRKTAAEIEKDLREEYCFTNVKIEITEDGDFNINITK